MKKFAIIFCVTFFVSNIFGICHAKFIKAIRCPRLYTYVLETEQGANNNHEIYLYTDSKGRNFLLIRANCGYVKGRGYLVAAPGKLESAKEAVSDILAYHVRRGTFGKNKIDYINLYIPFSKHFSEKMFEVYGVRTIIIDLPDIIYHGYIDGRFFVADSHFTVDDARRYVNK
ncbi:MAG: hypothetical protein J6O04_01670 [Selenomonadaceae bacterium]|nr:hypothetical protein [Selenomonadaceae bacterium]